MIITIYQPRYPSTYEDTIQVINDIKQLSATQLKKTDLLVLPEYANCAGMKNMKEIIPHIREYNIDFINVLTKKASDTNTNISVNMLIEEDHLFFNATIFITKTGEIKTVYKKTHLAYPEKYTMNLTEGNELYAIEVDHVIYSFATCFELYFAEQFEYIASLKPDIILAPSYQRSEDASVLKTQIDGRALDSESFVVRASYSLGKQSTKGGHSQISSPKGETILEAKQEIGLFSVEINEKEKRIRPLAHGLEKKTSRYIVENFRRPELYKQSGAIVRNKESYTYPRICAHRGFSHACPENTIPAFMAAIAVGADEIEFDLRITKDQKIVICHDATADRTTTIKGEISNLTLEEIKNADAGIYLSNEWEGIKMPTLEEVFKACAGLIMFNVHIYDAGVNGFVIDKVSKLAQKYNCEQSIYIAGGKEVLAYALKKAPHIERACLEAQGSEKILYYTEKYQCQRLQFFRNVTDDMIKKAKEMGVICNLFYADEVSEAREYINRGIDTILTNKASKIIYGLNKS